METEPDGTCQYSGEEFERYKYLAREPVTVQQKRVQVYETERGRTTISNEHYRDIRQYQRPPGWRTILLCGHAVSQWHS